METAACVLEETLREWGLTLSIVRTKLLVTGSGDEADQIDGEVECMTEFKYLGSIVEVKVGSCEKYTKELTKQAGFLEL